MRLLIAIPNYSKEQKDIDMLIRCIKSIHRCEPLLSFHTVVFDDKSPRFTDEDMFNIHSLNTKIVYAEENKGYSANVNRAIDYAAANNYDLILTLNSDTEVLTPFYLRVKSLFNYDRKIAVVGGLCLFPTGKIQSASFHPNLDGDPLQPDRNKYYALGDHGATQSRFVFGVTGAFQFIRVTSAVLIGKYSENYTLSYEDVEFCQRIWLSGYKCFYDSQIACNHYESATRGYHLGVKELQSLEQWHQDFSVPKLQAIELLIQKANP